MDLRLVAVGGKCPEESQREICKMMTWSFEVNRVNIGIKICQDGFAC